MSELESKPHQQKKKRDNYDVDRADGSAPYFDEKAKSYFSWYEDQSPGGFALRVRRKRILELLDGLNGKILDVGCGPGIMVQDLTHLGWNIWGIDAAPQMVEECCKSFGHLPQTHFSVGSATALNFPDEFFDVVICMGVIDRIAAYDVALKEMSRVTKKNGVLLISFPNLLSPYTAWKSYVFYPIISLLRPIYYFLCRRPQPSTLYNFSWRGQQRSFSSVFGGLRLACNVKDLLAEKEVQVIDTVYYYFNICLSPLDEFFPRWALKITEKLESCRMGRLKWLGSGFIVKAIKSE